MKASDLTLFGYSQAGQAILVLYRKLEYMPHSRMYIVLF